MVVLKYLNEEWRNIKGYEGKYQVSNLGRVRSVDRIEYIKGLNRYRKRKGMILKPKFCGEYYGVGLSGKNFYIHKLVGMAFPEICGEWFEGCQYDHIDGNRFNNVATNIRACTEKENHNNPITRKRNSEAKKGKTPWNKGLNYTFAERRLLRINNGG